MQIEAEGIKYWFSDSSIHPYLNVIVSIIFFNDNY